MGEHAQAAVLGLDGVVVHPDPGRVVRHLDVRAGLVGDATHADLDATDGRAALGSGAEGLDLGVPAVAPDGVVAVDRVAVGGVLAGVDDLEVVDVAVRLLEVAVAVEVVAVELVERPEVPAHLPEGPVVAVVGHLRVDPVGQRVTDQEPGVAARHATAVVAAVAGLVEGDLHPLGDGAVDAVLPVGLVLVELPHPVEVHVVVVAAVVVGLPQGGVVLAAVRLGDRVVHRPVERGGVRVAVRVGGVGRVTELGEDHEDLLLARGRDLAVDPAAQLLRRARAAGAETLLDRRLADRVVARLPGGGLQGVSARGVLALRGSRSGGRGGGCPDLPSGEGQHRCPDE